MTTYQYPRLNKEDAAVLLIDHQAGLVSLVVTVPEIMLAERSRPPCVSRREKAKTQPERPLRLRSGDGYPNQFKNNILALADIAKFFNLPTILTTRFEAGPNGPIVPELKEMFPDAPYIARPGQINAWDKECGWGTASEWVCRGLRTPS